MKCPHCGGTNFQWAKKCFDCGRPLTRPTAAPTITDRRQPQRRPSPELLFSIGDDIKEGIQVVEILEGGMGIVYLCRARPSARFWDRKHGRIERVTSETLDASDSAHWRWAFKTFRTELLARSGGRNRFRQECLFWSTLLPHPNIVRARNVESRGERWFLMLEYIDGGNLRQRLQSPLELPVALNIMLQFCVAMQFLSEHYGIVHRDIKPENVLLTKDGTVKVTDFGLVQNPTPDEGAVPVAEADLDERVTMAGAIAGTLPYMSPEQLDGQSLHPTSDVFASGVMFYEMLAGRRPFDGTTIADLRRQHTDELPEPLRECVDIAPEIHEIVHKCLAREPKDRFQRFSDLLEVLETYCRAHGLSHLIPNKPTVADIENSLTFFDWNGLGYSLAQLGESYRDPARRRTFFERSHDSYVRALAIDATGPAAHLNVAVSLCRLGRDSDALPYCAREIELHPDLAMAHSQLANIYFGLGRKDEGVRAYERAAELAPEDHVLWRQLAGVYSTMNREPDRSRAIERVKQLLAARPESEAAIAAIQAAIASSDWGDTGSAIDLFLYAVSRWPTLPLAWFNLGVTLHRTGSFERAKRYYDRALQLDARLVPALLHRGLASAALGTIDAACVDWQSAVSHGGDIDRMSAAKFLEIARLGPPGAVAMARDPKLVRPLLRHRMA